jgi:uncharacterized membrane protein
MVLWRSFGRVMVGTALTVAALLVPLADGAAQTPMELPPLDGDRRSSAVAINTRGEVAGTSIHADGTTTAVVWDRQLRPRPRPPLVGDSDSEAAAINPSGQVAGTSSANGVSTAVLWDPQGRPEALPPLDGDTDSEAVAINKRGEVAGTSTANGASTAVMWNRQGRPVALPPLAGDLRSVALAINDRGEALGFSIGARTTPVVWRKAPAGAQQGRSSGIGNRIPPNQLIERIDERSPAPTLPSGGLFELRGGGISIIVTD